MEINEKLKEIRKRKNISQSEIANAIGIAQRTYSDIEKGIIRLTVSDFLNICKFLKEDPINLVKDDNSIIISITKSEADVLNKLNQRIQNNINLNNVNINTSGDVIIGNNNRKK